MGWFRKFEVTGYRRGGWDAEKGGFEEYPVGYKKTTLLGKLAIFASILAASYFVVADEHMDFFGDPPEVRSAQDATEIAKIKYDDVYNRASAAGKFMLQYGIVTRVAVNRNIGGNGLQKSMNSVNDSTFFFNNACLKDTAYDINGGEIKGEFHGLFSSGRIDGSVPTAAAFAALDESNPDNLIVKSGHANSIDLHFTNLGDARGHMIPADSVTANVLETYGCETGIVGVSRSAYPSESEYIRNSRDSSVR